jgi:hypothetical protein
MAKKPEYYSEAQRLYVQERLTFEAIAQQLPVSDRSLREWAKEGEWVERREAFVEVQTQSHDKLHKMISLLIDRVNTSLENGEDPNPAQLNFIKGMAPSLVKLKEYEEKATPAATAGEAEKQQAATRYENVMEEMQKTLQQLGLGG